MNGILVFDQNQVVEEVEGVVKLAGGAASHSRQKIRGWKIQSLSSPPPFCRPTFFVHLHKSKKPTILHFAWQRQRNRRSIIRIVSFCLLANHQLWNIMTTNGTTETTSLVHGSKEDEENFRKLKSYQPWVLCALVFLGPRQFNMQIMIHQPLFGFDLMDGRERIFIWCISVQCIVDKPLERYTYLCIWYSDEVNWDAPPEKLCWAWLPPVQIGRWITFHEYDYIGTRYNI